MSFMNYRIFGQNQATPPVRESQQSELERLRSRQLSSLVRAGAQAKNAQQTMFEMHVVDLGQGRVNLQITLPSDFPMRAPQIKVSMPISHHYLDAYGNVTGHPDLNQWTAHSDVGRIVSEITGELRKIATFHQTPYSQAQSTAYSSPSRKQSAYTPAPAASVYSTPTPAQPPVTTTANKEAYRIQMPSVPSVFPELEELTASQLDEMLRDEKAVKKFIQELSNVKDLEKFRQDLMVGNMDIAKKTLALEDELRTLQESVRAKRTELRTAQETLASYQARQQQIVSRFRPDALLDQVSCATREADTMSDDIAHRFTQGDMAFAEFITQYLPLRQLYHQRTIKFNKLMQH